MAGIQNNIIFGGGFKLQASSAIDISNMQNLSTDVSNINSIGNPEGFISANPSSFCHDSVSGTVYFKKTGTGNTGWLAVGTVLSVSGTLNRVTATVGANPVIDISASYVGQSSITTLGTITTGVWNGTAIDATHGGTNQTTYATGDTLYASALNTLSKLPIGIPGQVYTVVAGVPAWATTPAFTGLSTLTDDVGSVINPVLNNIQLVGHVNEQGATKFSTVLQGVGIANINPMSASRWIVDSLGFNGTHTTIQAAINASTSGDNVFIMEGVYTENLTLKAGVNLVGYRGSGRTSTVTILGNCTLNTAGTSTITGCKLQTNGSFCISNTGTLASILNIIDCDIQAANSTAINYTNSNASSQIFISICTMNIGAVGNALHTMTSVGTLQYRYCNISNTGASTTASSNSAGNVIFYYCNIFSPLSTTASGAIQKRYSYVDTSAQNVTCLTTAGTGTTEIDFGGDSSGTATAIVVGAGTTVSLNSTDIYTSNAAAISGAGTLNFSILTFEGTSSEITVTTQTPRAGSNDAVVIKIPGAYPYTTVPQDGVILVDTSAARTIVPLANPTKGQMHRIKDSAGLAATFPITVTPSGKNIDGLASRTINSNYGSIDILYSGTEWLIL
jgi:hypothetical protein